MAVIFASVLVVAVGAAPASAAMISRAYVTHLNSDTVSVIDTTTYAVVATVPVGDGPRSVAVSSDGTRAYVTNQGSGDVSVIDTATNSVVATVPSGAGTFGVAVSQDGARVYVTNQESDSVTVINTATNTVVASVQVGDVPRGVAVTPDGRRAYVTNRGSDSVSVIDTATSTVAEVIGVGDGPRDVAVNPAGTRAYVTHNFSPVISVIETASGTVVESIPFSQFTAVAVNPAGTRVYVGGDRAGNNFAVIDTATNTVEAGIDLYSILDLAINPAGTLVYAATIFGELVVIDTATNTIVARPIFGQGAPLSGVAVAAVWVDTTSDGDGDGVDDVADNCPEVANPSQLDSDGDVTGDDCDADDDNDGVPDATDAFRLDPAESVDADGDGIGDNGDNCENVSNSDQADADVDGVGDACENAAPSVSNNGPSQTVQYSDRITSVTITASDVDSPSTALEASTTPLAGLSLVALSPTSATPRTWSLQGRAMVPSGTYAVRVTVTDGYDPAYTDLTIVVGQEDAAIDYSGDSLVVTPTTAANGAATVNLAAVLKEAVDGDAGDQLATTHLKFTVYKFSDTPMTSPVKSCTSSVANIDGQPGTGLASCTVSLTADAYTVKVELVPNDFYVAPVENEAVTVVNPGTGSTNGAGSLNELNLSSRSSFGFSVKYLKGSLQGKSQYIYRMTLAAGNTYGLPAGDYNWIIKSNAMTAMSSKCSTTTPAVCTASFSGKNTITAVNRATGVATSLGGNYQFQVDVTDTNKPVSGPDAAPDTYAIRVWNSTTPTYYQLGTPASQVQIARGNIVVKP